ncbi:MAG: hypothetical protein M0D55_01255 [Elusimicrobiota bacterium]|nr:MAG: hypothetical protein M0D55_01255 [Elusimicrobiota bacterium]
MRSGQERREQGGGRRRVGPRGPARRAGESQREKDGENERRDEGQPRGEFAFPEDGHRGVSQVRAGPERHDGGMPEAPARRRALQVPVGQTMPVQAARELVHLDAVSVEGRVVEVRPEPACEDDHGQERGRGGRERRSGGFFRAAGAQGQNGAWNGEQDEPGAAPRGAAEEDGVRQAGGEDPPEAEAQRPAQQARAVAPDAGQKGQGKAGNAPAEEKSQRQREAAAGGAALRGAPEREGSGDGGAGGEEGERAQPEVARRRPTEDVQEAYCMKC